MKTAVSIPDEVFQKGEAAAKRLKVSRSELYARAVDAYVDAHSPDAVTDAMNAALEEIGPQDTRLVNRLSRSVLKKGKW